MRLFLLGLSYVSAEVSVRERVAFAPERTPEALRALVQAPSVQEGMVLSTCNRVELYGVGPKAEEGLVALRSLLTSFHGLPARSLDAFLYERQGPEAIRHLFRVASSLDSMVVGEPQILGQVKRAYEAARKAGAVGSMLHRAMHRAIAVAKRARTETGIGKHEVSLPAAAVALARKIFETLDGRTAMLVGVGKMGALAARHFQTHGAAKLFILNRTLARAQEIARSCGAVALPMEAMLQNLAAADIAVFATAVDGWLLNKTAVGDLGRVRRHRPLLLIDISVPRVVDPAVHSLEGVYLYDIDDLRGWVEENKAEREREAGLAEAIVANEAESFVAMLAQAKLVPTIARLNEKIGGICQSELARTLSVLESLCAEEREALTRMTHAIARRIAHDPIQRLKIEHAAGNGFATIEAVNGLFNLNTDDVAVRSQGSVSK